MRFSPSEQYLSVNASIRGERLIATPLCEICVGRLPEGIRLIGRRTGGCYRTRCVGHRHEWTSGGAGYFCTVLIRARDNRCRRCRSLNHRAIRVADDWASRPGRALDRRRSPHAGGDDCLCRNGWSIDADIPSGVIAETCVIPTAVDVSRTWDP